VARRGRRSRCPPPCIFVKRTRIEPISGPLQRLLGAAPQYTIVLPGRPGHEAAMDPRYWAALRGSRPSYQRFIARRVGERSVRWGTRTTAPRSGHRYAPARPAGSSATTGRTIMSWALARRTGRLGRGRHAEEGTKAASRSRSPCRGRLKNPSPRRIARSSALPGLVAREDLGVAEAQPPARSAASSTGSLCCLVDRDPLCASGREHRGAGDIEGHEVRGEPHDGPVAALGEADVTLDPDQPAQPRLRCVPEQPALEQAAPEASRSGRGRAARARGRRAPGSRAPVCAAPRVGGCRGIGTPPSPSALPAGGLDLPSGRPVERAQAGPAVSRTNRFAPSTRPAALRQGLRLPYMPRRRVTELLAGAT
jgi:hypothetical protein